jgi:hypothetical protein
MLRDLPDDLPLFGALLFGLSLVVFGYTGMYTEMAIGRPSSTAGIAFFFIPIWGVFAAAAGLVLGFIVRAVWRRLTELERRTWILPAILSCAVVASAGAGAFGVIRYEREAQPAVRVASGLLIREFRGDLGKAARSSTTLYDSDGKSAGISWARNDSELRLTDDRVIFRDTVSGKQAEFSNSALDYVTRVDAVSLSAPRGRALLAIVISGRATGRRAIVAVIDDSYGVVFEERVERFWGLAETPLEIREAASAAGEYVVVAPFSNRSLILRPKEN